MTRANINISNENINIYFYRSCDGYPENTARDLQEKIENSKDINELIVKLLCDKKYSLSSYRGSRADFTYVINNYFQDTNEIELMYFEPHKKLQYHIFSYMFGKQKQINY